MNSLTLSLDIDKVRIYSIEKQKKFATLTVTSYRH